MQKTKTIYYSDPLNEDFGPTPHNLKKITGNYRYNRDNIFIRFFDFLTYRFILTPIAFIYTKLIARIKLANKHLLKDLKKEGVIVYANHTHAQADAFGPPVHFFPKKVTLVTNSANVSLPILGNLTKAWGAFPLPEDYTASKRFVKEFALRLKRKGVVIIYPEAHLWPFYTGIRPFTHNNFAYSVKFNVKSYALTSTYQKSKKGKLKRIVYLDGPFTVDEKLSSKDASVKLRDAIYEVMKKRSKLSTYEKIRYVKRSE
ncbi:MAG: lysophospholipid acyltransferase family protein [Bacilli bacterium]|jgi:1-acyl-sn-glycerol-3-phosphate acyltransferase|nr:hypothetical protein [Bacilli bacterium]